MINVSSELSNLKSKVDKLEIDQLVPVPVDLSKLSDVVKKDIKKDVYNVKIKDVKDEILDITNLATNTTLNVKINEVKNEIPSITNLVTTAALNAKINEVKNKIPNITNLDTTTALTAVENKIDHSKDITTPVFNKLTAENFNARLAQANLASKNDIANFVKNTDFDDKLKFLNKKITSNKTKHVLVENEVNELSKKYQQKD